MEREHRVEVDFRAHLDAALARLHHYVAVVPLQSCRHLTQTPSIDLALAGEWRVARRALHPGLQSSGSRVSHTMPRAHAGIRRCGIRNVGTSGGVSPRTIARGSPRQR